MGQRTIIGEQQQSGGVFVQSPDGKDIRAAALHQVYHSMQRMGVTPGGGIAGGLIQRKVG